MNAFSDYDICGWADCSAQVIPNGQLCADHDAEDKRFWMPDAWEARR